jgi:uncharacterized protein YbbK (DUF523 family)
MKKMKIVSACLVGIPTRYDGTARPCQEVIDMVKNNEAIPVCPEVLGGLPTPRQPAERLDGRVLAKNGEDLTRSFTRGAQEGLRIALLAHCDEAILKSDSPSCGCGRIHDGTFCGGYVTGDGVFAEVLKRHGIKVRTEQDL